MKKRFSILILLAIGVFVVFQISNATGSVNLEKHNWPQQELTEEQKLLKQKMEIKLNDGWSDIKKSFNIDEKEYFQLDLSQKEAFKKGAGPIQDKQKIESIIKGGVNPGTSNLPVGSLFPLILIKNDGSEVLVGIKEADGNNILRKYTLKDDVWTEEVKEKKGKLKLKMEEI